MKAIVITRSGGPEVLELMDIPAPVPGETEVLIEVHAASVNPLDSYSIRGPLSFLPLFARPLKRRRVVPGADLAGRVVQTGTRETRFKPGDDVFGATFRGKGAGAFAEYACVSEENLALKPANLSYEEAAAVPIAAITALQAIRDHGEVRRGQTVLVDGASGGVGTFAVQIAKAFGADVTAVCSPTSGERARTLGASRALDYTREDFAQGDQRFDVIIGANAYHSVFSYRHALKPGGIFVMVGGSLSKILQALLLGPLLSRIGDRKMRFFVAKINTKDLESLQSLLEARTIVPVIDRRFSLPETGAALRYLETKHANGKIVISMGTGGDQHAPDPKGAS